MCKDVMYHKQILTLQLFGSHQEPCLFIKYPNQIHMPHMEFVGGYPNEYCIFLRNLTEEELQQITELNGEKIDLKKEIDDLYMMSHQ